MKRGVCSQINHFPEDADFDHDGAEYVLRKSTLDYQNTDDETRRRRERKNIYTYFLIVYLLAFWSEDGQNQTCDSV